MRIHPKQATVVLNLLAIVAVVWLYYIDKILVTLLPSVFCMGRRIVLKK